MLRATKLRVPNKGDKFTVSFSGKKEDIEEIRMEYSFSVGGIILYSFNKLKGAPYTMTLSRLNRVIVQE